MPIRSEDEPVVSPKHRPARSWALGCLGAFLVFALFAAGYLAWASLLPPPVTFPTAPLPSPNGFDAVRAATTRLARAPGNADVSEFTGLPMGRLRPAVRQQQPLLNELRAALRLSYRNPPETDPVNPDVTWMASYRQAARALAAEARVGFAGGRPAAGWSSSLDAVDLGVRMQNGGLFIHHLVGAAVSAIGVSRADGNADGLSAAEARALGARLDRILAELPPLGDILQEEYRWSQLWFRRAATGQPGLSAEFDGEEMTWQDRAKRLGLRYFYPKAWSARALRRYWEAALHEAEKPPWLRASVPEPRDPFIEGLLLDPMLISRQHSRLQAHLRLLRLELALQEYHARSGEFPPRLTALPGTDPPLLQDPFDGKALRYRRKGQGYLLYSVGENAVDDGGAPGQRAHPDRGDLVAGRLFPRR